MVEIHDIRPDLVAAEKPKTATDHILEAVAKEVARIMTSDADFIAAIAKSITTHNEFQTCVKEVISESYEERDFSRAVEEVVNVHINLAHEIERALEDHTISANDVEDLGEFIKDYLDDNIRVNIVVD